MIFERFIKTIKDNSLLEFGDKVLIAVSGGADSVALLSLLSEVRDRYKLEMVIAHLNHNLRGAESDADEQFVRKIGEQWRIPVFVERLPEHGLTGYGISNIEEWARSKRFDFFHRLCMSLGAQKVALGHNLNDQAETVLMRVLHGSGTLGLAGIPFVREALYIRPLLSINRDEIKTYLRARGLEWREDSSNSDPRFLRNRVRNELLPFIAAHYSPTATRVLARIANNLRADAEALEYGVSSLMSSLAEIAEKRIVLNVPRLLSCPDGMRRHLLRHSMIQIAPRHAVPSSRELEQIQGLLRPNKSGRSARWNTLSVRRDYDSLILEVVCPGVSSDADYDYLLQIPGRVQVKQNQSEFEAILGTSIADSQCSTVREFWLSQDELHAGLRVRNWKAGDSYHPVGSSSPKQLTELFSRRRISWTLRRSWPVVTLNSKIIFMKDFPLSADIVTRIRASGDVRVLIKERTLP